MSPETRSPAAAGTANRADAHSSVGARRNHIAPHIPDASLTKRGILLRAFLEGEVLTRMDAWRTYGDGAANTTVSTLQRLHGVHISRRMIDVSGRHRQAHVAEYWLADADRPDALQALARELRSAGHPDEADAVLELIDREVA